MAQIKTFSRERDAKRAALAAGLADDRFTTHATDDGRFYYMVKAAPHAAKTGTKEAPGGKRATILTLCMRPDGASRAELIAATGWEAAPWKWLLSNPKGDGLCDKYGYQLSVVKTGRNNQYFVSA